MRSPLSIAATRLRRAYRFNQKVFQIVVSDPFGEIQVTGPNFWKIALLLATSYSLFC
jgi:hypothetical protein